MFLESCKINNVFYSRSQMFWLETNVCYSCYFNYSFPRTREYLLISSMFYAHLLSVRQFTLVCFLLLLLMLLTYIKLHFLSPIPMSHTPAASNLVAVVKEKFIISSWFFFFLE